MQFSQYFRPFNACVDAFNNNAAYRSTCYIVDHALKVILKKSTNYRNLMRAAKILVRNLISMTRNMSEQHHEMFLFHRNGAHSFTAFFTFSRISYACSRENEFDRVKGVEEREMVR